MMETPQTIEIPVELANSVTQYLSNRPYIEVAGLISQLQAAAKLSIENNRNQVVPAVTPAPGAGSEEQNEQ